MKQLPASTFISAAVYPDGSNVVKSPLGLQLLPATGGEVAFTKVPDGVVVRLTDPHGKKGEARLTSAAGEAIFASSFHSFNWQTGVLTLDGKSTIRLQVWTLPN